MAKEVLDTILSIQPKEGGGAEGGETRETVVYRQAEEMLQRVPSNYIRHEVCLHSIKKRFDWYILRSFEHKIFRIQ